MYPSCSAPGLQNNTLLFPILVGHRWRAQNRPDRLIENRLQVPLRERRALDVVRRIDWGTIECSSFKVLKFLMTIVVGYWRHVLLAEGFDC